MPTITLNDGHAIPQLGFGVFLGSSFSEMAANQVANLTERRIRTVSYLCRA